MAAYAYSLENPPVVWKSDDTAMVKRSRRSDAQAGKEITSRRSLPGTVNLPVATVRCIQSLQPIEADLIETDNDRRSACPVRQYHVHGIEDYTFYAINLTNGKVQWVHIGLTIRRPGHSITIFTFFPTAAVCIALISERRQRWWKHLFEFLAVIAAALLQAMTREPVMVSQFSQDGSDRIDAASAILDRMGNDRTDRVYLRRTAPAADFRQITANYPVYHRYPDRLPLPEFEPDDGAEALENPTQTRRSW